MEKSIAEFLIRHSGDPLVLYRDWQTETKIIIKDPEQARRAFRCFTRACNMDERQKSSLQSFIQL